VIAFVAHDLGKRFQTDLRFRLGRLLRFPLHHVGQIPGRLGQRFPNRCGVTLVGRLQRHRDHSAALHVHGVLGLMRQMRGSVLHLRHPRIRVTGTYPLPIGSLFLSFPVDADQVFPCGSLNPGLPRQPGEKLVVTGSVIPPHDAPHGRIRFQSRCIHAHPN